MNYYTLDEKKKIVEFVKAYPTNLVLAFELAGKELGRSPKSVSQHWYKYLKREGRVFNLDRKFTNTKNTIRVDREVLETKLKAKLALRSAVKSDKARADVLAITKALRALARK